jgi:TIR domain-containing protein
VVSEVESLPRIFVSFAHADSEQALDLATALEEAGSVCWHMYGKRKLKTFPVEIAARLEESDVLALVYSANTEKSKRCPREVMAAIDLDLDLALVLLDGLRPEDLRGGKYQLFMNLETPLHWSTPQKVAAELVERFLDVGTPQPMARAQNVQRVVIVDDVDEQGALEKALRVLGVTRDEVLTRVQRPFGRGTSGVLRVAVKEPGPPCSGRLVVTRNPTLRDARVQKAATQLNLARATMRVRVLEQFGPYKKDDARYVLVCAPNFPVDQRAKGDRPTMG